MLPVSNDYIGEIVSAELTENNGKVGAIVVVRPDGSPETARWYGSFSETYISSGRNEGKMVGEVTAATLGEFGCSDFSKIGELKGAKVAFGIKHKPGENGKVWVEANFIHPPRAAKPVTSAGLAGINRFKGAAIEAARSAPKRTAAPSNGGGRQPGDDSDDFGPTNYDL
ncbi:MAG TPA: hypothetical protein VM686_00440 [Polyangiaceae bacterium]|jgi:hypothetical protein|nr:hypothetical protein [Polyangiaceae bacterium]